MRKNHKKFNYLIACVFLSLAMISVGSTVIISKIITENFPPFTAITLRFGIALPFFIICMKYTKTSWPSFNLHDSLIIFLQATVGSVGYTALLLYGLKFTNAADAGILLGTLPAVSIFIAIAISREWPSGNIWLALLICSLGIFATHFHSSQKIFIWKAHLFLGSLLVFMAVICEGLFIQLNKYLHVSLKPLTLSTMMTIISLFLAIIPACFEHPFKLSQVPWIAWASIIYYAIIPTVLGFILWYEGTSRIKTSEAALFTALVPLSSIILAALVLHESITFTQLLGCGCILLAIWLVIKA